VTERPQPCDHWANRVTGAHPFHPRFTNRFRRRHRTRATVGGRQGTGVRDIAEMLIAHAWDLHVGRDAATYRAARLLATALEDAGATTTVVTGDVTHRGSLAEMDLFRETSGRLPGTGPMVVVSGNHDPRPDLGAWRESAGEADQIGARDGSRPKRDSHAACRTRSATKADPPPIAPAARAAT
jgi:hypothetical protein